MSRSLFAPPFSRRSRAGGSFAGGLLICAGCLVGLAAIGCTESQRATIMGEGFHDDMSGAGKNIRGNGSGEIEHDGLSTKSRQIEDDLK